VHTQLADEGPWPMRALARAVAHGIRNPLAAVQIAMQFMRASAKLPPVLRTDLDRALDEIRRCVQIVDRVQRYASAGTARRARHDLNDVILVAREVLEMTAARGQVGIQFRLTTQPLPLLISACELEWLLLDVVENAVGACAPGQLIEICTAVDGEAALLIIRDEGIGMGAEVLERACLPFFSTRHNICAPGLGLTIARQIVLAHGGRMLLESEVRRGTSVEVWLPLDSKAGPGES